MQNLRLLACVVAALGSLTAAGCGDDNDCDNGNCAAQGALRVQNNCSFAITEIHVTSVGGTTWEANLISGTTLGPGESLTVDVACGQYDALLIGEGGKQSATIHNVKLCSSKADWIIDKDTCLAFTNTGPNDPGSDPASGAAH